MYLFIECSAFIFIVFPYKIIHLNWILGKFSSSRLSLVEEQQFQFPPAGAVMHR